jgi:Phage integrase family
MDNFAGAWQRACLRAGCSRMLRHDLRRTAVRNMVNLGIPERVVMQVTGYRTRSILDCYHIVSPGDLKDVARQLSETRPTIQAQFQAQQATERS